MKKQHSMIAVAVFAVSMGLASGCTTPVDNAILVGDTETFSSAQQSLQACNGTGIPYPIPCYQDADGDGHGVGSLIWPSVCSGSCVENGYADSDDDCDDASSSRWQTLRCYVDADGDHFGTAPKVDVCGGEHCLEGISGYSYNSGDCDDADAAIHPQALEIDADGIDNDCEHGVDQAEFFFFDPAVSTNSSTSITMTMRLRQPSERAAAFGNDLSARIHYKKLDNGSGAWQTYPLLGKAPLTIPTCAVGQSCKGSITLPNLAPLSVYTVQLEFYRTSDGIRIYPYGKTGADCGYAPCFNTDILYSMTKGDPGPLRDARWGIVMTALHRYGQHRNTDMGFWNSELMYELELAEQDTAYCSEFYAAAAKDYLIEMNPCQYTSAAATPQCDSSETGDSERKVTALKAWFNDYGASQSYEYVGPDMSALKPGDWLGVSPTDEDPDGHHTQMFLGWDATTKEYWAVEGNGSVTATWNKTPSSKYTHSINVTSHHHCKDDSANATCGNNDYYVQRIGNLSAAMVDP